MLKKAQSSERFTALRWNHAGACCALSLLCYARLRAEWETPPSVVKSVGKLEHFDEPYRELQSGKLHALKKLLYTFDSADCSQGRRHLTFERESEDDLRHIQAIDCRCEFDRNSSNEIEEKRCLAECGDGRISRSGTVCALIHVMHMPRTFAPNASL